MPTFVETEIAEFRKRLNDVADAVTNSCIQAIAAEMKRQGLKGGLRDSRKLRNELLTTVKKNLTEDILGDDDNSAE